MKTSSLFLSFAFLFVTACGAGTPTSTPPPAEKPAEKPADGHGPHGAEKSLGNLTIGAHTFEVVQSGDVKAGEEAVLDLKFPAGKPLPAVARAWVGIESAVGSIKDRIGKNGDGDGFHGHIETPAKMPEGSKIWIELEENGTTTRGSVAWK